MGVARAGSKVYFWRERDARARRQNQNLPLLLNRRSARDNFNAETHTKDGRVTGEATSFKRAHAFSLCCCDVSANLLCISVERAHPFWCYVALLCCHGTALNTWTRLRWWWCSHTAAYHAKLIVQLINYLNLRGWGWKRESALIFPREWHLGEYGFSKVCVASSLA